MEIAEVVAREAIRDVLARYNHAGDRGRLDEMVELFTVDGVLEIAGDPPIVGRPAIRGFFVDTAASLRAATGVPLLRHHVSSVLIDLDRDLLGASATSYFLVVTERGPDHWGRYRDELVQDGPVWRFTRRRVRTDGAAPDSWGATRVRGPIAPGNWV